MRHMIIALNVQNIIHNAQRHVVYYGAKLLNVFNKNIVSIHVVEAL